VENRQQDDHSKSLEVSGAGQAWEYRQRSVQSLDEIFVAGLTIWGLTPDGVDAMIHAGAVDQVREKLLENNLEYKVSMEDVQKAIDEENPKPGEDLEGRKGFRLTWNYYHNLDDIYDFLHYLEHTYPKLCTVRTIGGSAEGRPIKLLKISNGRKGNRAVFLEGGIHSREWISPATVTYIIYQFVSGYNKETSSMRGLDWYVVPVLNPDGYLYSYNIDRMWRKNRSVTKSKECLGVDLNRNWGYDWGKNGSSEDPCHNSYSGRKPFSEPETTSVARFFLDNPDIDWRGYVSIHSYGQYIVYPWGAPNAVLDDNAELNKVATEAAVVSRERQHLSHHFSLFFFFGRTLSALVARPTP
jgi:murein tripeptide amidase MpaA